MMSSNASLLDQVYKQGRLAEDPNPLDDFLSPASSAKDRDKASNPQKRTDGGSRRITQVFVPGTESERDRKKKELRVNGSPPGIVASEHEYHYRFRAHNTPSLYGDKHVTDTYKEKLKQRVVNNLSSQRPQLQHLATESNSPNNETRKLITTLDQLKQRNREKLLKSVDVGSGGGGGSKDHQNDLAFSRLSDVQNLINPLKQYPRWQEENLLKLFNEAVQRKIRGPPAYNDYTAKPIKPYEIRAPMDPKVGAYREFDARTFGTTSAFVSTERYALDNRVPLNDVVRPIMQKPTDYSILKECKFDKKHI